jgi:hypothetical protein
MNMKKWLLECHLCVCMYVWVCVCTCPFLAPEWLDGLYSYSLFKEIWIFYVKKKIAPQLCLQKYSVYYIENGFKDSDYVLVSYGDHNIIFKHPVALTFSSFTHSRSGTHDNYTNTIGNYYTQHPYQCKTNPNTRMTALKQNIEIVISFYLIINDF